MESVEGGSLRALAAGWRAKHPQHLGGVVLIWGGVAYGWKNELRDAAHEQPGAYAVDTDGHVYVAQGGDDYSGAKAWVVLPAE